MTIPADRITFNDDGTAWLIPGPVGPGAEHIPYERAIQEWREAFYRPCDTCGGNWQDYMEPLDVDGNVVSPCPNCIDGRHTFDIEVATPHPRPQGDDTHAIDRYRASIVPGMVLEIVEGLGDLPERSCVWMSSEGVFWLMHEGQSSIITLPPAAAPGMWAVQLAALS